MWNENEASEPDAEARARDRQHAEGARRAVRQVTQIAQEGAGAAFHDQQERAAGSVHAVADALRSSADSLRRSNSSAIAGYVEQAARRIDDASRRLREEDVQSLIATTEDYARRQPAVFLGASVAIGLAVGRFLKSSSERRRSQQAGGHGDGAVTSGTTIPYDGPAKSYDGRSDGQATPSEFLEY